MHTDWLQKRKSALIDHWQIKKDLQEFIDTDTSLDEEMEFYDKFVSKY